MQQHLAVVQVLLAPLLLLLLVQDSARHCRVEVLLVVGTVALVGRLGRGAGPRLPIEVPRQSLVEASKV